jgi:predicted kinase
VRLSRKGAEVVLPEGFSLGKARQLMLEAQQYDGVLEIRENGDIVVTDEAYENFKQTLGVDCRAITIEDAYDQYQELRRKLNEFARKHGVKVPS